MTENVSPAETPPLPEMVLRLFVTGNSPRSVAAIANATRLCRDVLTNNASLEVIDMYARPEVAAEAQIIAVPTLLKISPGPTRRVIGDLADLEKVVAALGIVLP